MVPTGIVSTEERERVEAEVIDIFLTELGQFQSMEGPFQSRHIWIIAEDEKTMTHGWHHKYAFPFTKVFGKFAVYFGDIQRTHHPGILGTCSCNVTMFLASDFVGFLKYMLASALQHAIPLFKCDKHLLEVVLLI
jgi:hypothetical protein